LTIAVVSAEMLPQILWALTRYSVNDPKFPVNDGRCSPGVSGFLLSALRHVMLLA
jgi:hypothetical protein